LGRLNITNGMGSPTLSPILDVETDDLVGHW
jgi:hypothetical protein